MAVRVKGNFFVVVGEVNILKGFRSDWAHKLRFVLKVKQ